MDPQPIHASSVYGNPPIQPHAVRFGAVVYTGAILPMTGEGAVVDSQDVAAQSRQAFENLRAVLTAAGASMGDVAKLTFYVPSSASGQLPQIYEVRDRFLRPSQQAGSVIPVALPEPSTLIAIEAIAHINAPKRPIGANPTSGWADALHVADTLYASARYGEGATFAEKAKNVYDTFDKTLNAARVSWRDVVRVHQFATRPDVVFDETRIARAPYLRNHEFLSTSVVCQPAEIIGASPGWQLVVDIEAALGQRIYSSAPGIWSNPGGLHIVKSGSVGYLTAQMSRTGDGILQFPDDPERHTDLVCRNYDGMLQSANLSWANIIHARTFCQHRKDVPIARAVLDHWLAGTPCARTELVVDFFNVTPRPITEIELTASV
jgi:enamine deaminase RidA (YjgF/YER057c/UK114 family)